MAGTALATNVVTLDDETFDSTLRDIPLALVKFYAPWCGHCKNLEPKWNEAADKLASEGANLGLEGVRLAKLDADSQKMSGGKFGVRSFPTIKLFRFGHYTEDFDGERTVEGILQYLSEKNKVAVNREITVLSTLKSAIKAAERPIIVGLFSDKSGIDYRYFAEVVVPFSGNGIDAYHSFTPSVLEGFGFYGGSSITMYRPYAKPAKVVYRGTIFKQNLKDWIVANAVPAVGVYDKDSQGLYKLSTTALVRLVSSQEEAGAKEVLTSLSKTFASTVKFATSLTSQFESEVEAHCEKGAPLCLIGHEAPKNGKAGKVFGQVLPSIDADRIKAFVEDLLAKRLVARVKSEAAAAAPVAGQVGVIVGSTFQSLVIDAEKDVLIEFYAPWCGHCKNLEPKYAELASEVSSEFSTLLIAKMDFTANDLPEEYRGVYGVEGFPTIYFSPRGSKKAPVKYEGGREVADMKAWLAEKRRS
eukprot:CAMPEP_0176431336 /NCGR_PEP_ID=MMETSP0127-20121128/14759_1 /TAXON_ID=938130 /ORGANISM="Platyophrya macrostoma, Strain WH" /LENGTH=471 /DNA_ID=CAMNT_0017813339 /DNA_START=111 /DNA_END=1526 /DNA_ORIENTATION=-